MGELVFSVKVYREVESTPVFVTIVAKKKEADHVAVVVLSSRNDLRIVSKLAPCRERRSLEAMIYSPKIWEAPQSIRCTLYANVRITPSSNRFNEASECLVRRVVASEASVGEGSGTLMAARIEY